MKAKQFGLSAVLRFHAPGRQLEAGVKNTAIWSVLLSEAAPPVMVVNAACGSRKPAPSLRPKSLLKANWPVSFFTKEAFRVTFLFCPVPLLPGQSTLRSTLVGLVLGPGRRTGQAHHLRGHKVQHGIPTSRTSYVRVMRSSSQTRCVNVAQGNPNPRFC
jgi:hypothetical protein